MLPLILTAAAAPPAPIPLADGVEASPLTMVIVGKHDAATAAAISARNPDVVVLTGVDARSDLEGWTGDHGVIAMSDRNPKGRFLKRFPHPSKSGEPYGQLELKVGDTRWRVVYATTYSEPLARWNDQQFWLPSAADPSAYDRMILLLDHPVHTVSDLGTRSEARILLDDVQDVTKPIALPLVIAGNTRTNEAYLPGGRFGELHVVAGLGTGEAAGLDGGAGFLRPPDPAPGAEVGLKGGALPGFWWLTLDDGDVTATFVTRNGDAWHTTYTLVRDGAGWHLPAPN